MTGEALAKFIITRLQGEGHEAFLVGGCVRDLLLGRVAKDFDVATSALPGELLRLFPGADQVGAHFGVVLVQYEGAQVEVATYRSDGDYADGRRPIAVTFEADSKQDALRRDFTINALLMNPASGEIVDYIGGRADLGSRLIRAIGDPERRFREDHLRLLRAVRFAARLNFDIEQNTLAAMQVMAPLVKTVAAERVRDEISRILTEGGASRGFALLDASGLLEQVLPEVAAMKGVQQPPEFHPEGDVWVHTLLMLEGLSEPSLPLALGILLHDVGKPATFQVADRIRFNGHVESGVAIAHRLLVRLRYSKEIVAQVEALIANHMKFKDVPRMRDSTLKRFLRMPAFEEHMELHRLDCLSSHGGLESYRLVRNKQQELPAEQLSPAPLLTGKDLIQAGYKPGRLFGVILNEVEEAQLDGRIQSKEEAWHLARTRLPLASPKTEM